MLAGAGPRRGSLQQGGRRLGARGPLAANRCRLIVRSLGVWALWWPAGWPGFPLT